ncbi:GNAT family N-acetyltransferase [Flavobacteriaceae bacterium XHP0103]|uniref:GNAT family N-acetyltransferase n=1 Tax=Marixanthotalea marina TaxID=2844359 RepID=UPI002989B898|nr:GNAT family N-acetyltransferase [Marixanthotalea marina]MBU3820604.1 GNAT family N-acetyltransferase [Marixanthotalea marina]
MLKIIIKPFDALTKQELYSILQLRSEVFVMEQHCIYQDVDGKDQKAFHLMGYKNDALVAYTRIFKPGDYFKEASIGRVLVKKSFRKHRYGYAIMEASVHFIKNELKQSKIKISAQLYLKLFYNNIGFKEEGEDYLEDDIPHIAMILKK